MMLLAFTGYLWERPSFFEFISLLAVYFHIFCMLGLVIRRDVLSVSSNVFLEKKKEERGMGSKRTQCGCWTKKDVFEKFSFPILVCEEWRYTTKWEHLRFFNFDLHCRSERFLDGRCWLDLDVTW